MSITGPQIINTQMQQSICGTNLTLQTNSGTSISRDSPNPIQGPTETRTSTKPTCKRSTRQEVTLTKPTLVPLHSPASSSCSGSSASAIGGEKRDIPHHDNTPYRSLRRRPGLSDLQQYRSLPELPHDLLFLPPKSVARRKPMRRALSAGPALRPASRFNSPDRYTTTRSSLHLAASPLRTNHLPSLLESQERFNRHTSSNIPVFQSGNRENPPGTMIRPDASRLTSLQPPHYTPSFVSQATGVISQQDRSRTSNEGRRASVSSIWHLGGRSFVLGQLHSVDLGNGTLAASGLTAPISNSNFHDRVGADEHIRKHERRLALALNIDVAQRVLSIAEFSEQNPNVSNSRRSQYQWFNSGWTRDHSFNDNLVPKSSALRPEKVVPNIAFRVLDAPRLKDDYYCSVVAYCKSFPTLAVALTHRVYLWTEKHGVRYPPIAPTRQANYVTCLAFSSDEGCKAILAISRQSGHVTLWSLLEQRARFELSHPSMACSVAFKPVTTRRYSQSTKKVTVCEDLLVGDDSGRIYYYSVVWPEDEPGSVNLVTKLEAHTQNVCGLAWAPHGNSFVSGGNDNNALLFLIEDVLDGNELADIRKATAVRGFDAGGNGLPSHQVALTSIPTTDDHNDVSNVLHAYYGSNSSNTIRPSNSGIQLGNPEFALLRGRGAERLSTPFGTAIPTPPSSPTGRSFPTESGFVNQNIVGRSNVHKRCFRHAAAIKAIAFAPWQPTLLATGGGSNDRQIHFHHTETGTTLAVINVFAQVTSLVWSLTRREIAATFGYAQPEHEIRIAVFAWPSCECVVSIPWERKPSGEIGRALWAIPYPSGPNDAAPERLQEASPEQDFWETQRYRPTASNLQGSTMQLTPEPSPERQTDSANRARIRHFTRGEGETWASRTEEEGSLIVACSDQTVKFFEVWAGKSKGKSRGLGSKAGVLGGSAILEGCCVDVAIEEIGGGQDVIR